MGRGPGRTIEWEGKTYTTGQAAKVAGVPAGAMKSRLQMGWSVERAMTTPSRGSDPITVASRTTGTARKLIVKRMETMGMSAEEAARFSPVRVVEFSGRRVPLTTVLHRLGMNRQTYDQRIIRGWPESKALSTPIRKQRKSAK